MRKRLFMRFLMFFRFTTYSWPGGLIFVELSQVLNGIYILAMRFIPIVILLSAGSDPWFELVVHCCYFLVFCRPCKFLGDYNCPGKVLFAEIVSVFGNGWIVIAAVEVIGSGQVGRRKSLLHALPCALFLTVVGAVIAKMSMWLMFKSSGFHVGGGRKFHDDAIFLRVFFWTDRRQRCWWIYLHQCTYCPIVLCVHHWRGYK